MREQKTKQKLKAYSIEAFSVILDNNKCHFNPAYSISKIL